MTRDEIAAALEGRLDVRSIENPMDARQLVDFVLDRFDPTVTTERTDAGYFVTVDMGRETVEAGLTVGAASRPIVRNDETIQRRIMFRVHRVAVEKIAGKLGLELR